MPFSTHCPSSRPVEELLLEEAGFTHVLLTLKTEATTFGTAPSEIADAGGRFLIDLRKVGLVRTEGMRYHPLSVEPTASVVCAYKFCIPKFPCSFLSSQVTVRMFSYL